MCHPEFGRAEESTLVDGPGLEQRFDAAIGAADEKEARAAPELPTGHLYRGASKRCSRGLLRVKGGVPDRPRERRQPEGFGGEAVAPRSRLPTREAQPAGKLCLLFIV